VSNWEPSKSLKLIEIDFAVFADVVFVVFVVFVVVVLVVVVVLEVAVETNVKSYAVKNG